MNFLFQRDDGKKEDVDVLKEWKKLWNVPTYLFVSTNEACFYHITRVIAVNTFNHVTS